MEISGITQSRSEVQVVRQNKLIAYPGGYSTKSYTWRLCPEVNIPFLTEKVPLSFSFY